MTAPRRNEGPRRWLVWSVSLLAGLVGLKYGYEFGQRLSGTVVGVVTAVNLAVFCAFVGGAIVEKVLSSRAPNRDNE